MIHKTLISVEEKSVLVRKVFANYIEAISDGLLKVVQGWILFSVISIV